MNIVSSKALELAVSAKLKQDMRDQLKKLATEYVHTSDGYSMTEGMKLAAKHSTENLGLAVVSIPQGLLVFSLKDKSADEWAARVATLSKKELATPRKVLVKMTALRIGKLRGAISGENPFRIREGRNPPIPVASDLGSSAKIIEYVESVSMPSRGLIHERAQELKEFVSRDDISEDIVHDAWGLVVAKEVMES